MSSVPLSIGLPVRNGQRYLAEAVRAILSQTYDRFELIISDNASEDGSREICREFERKDERVRYFRHRADQGASRNFNFTVEQARGPYFKWASHDDVCAPRFLEACVSELDRRADVVLAHTRSLCIDESSKPIGRYASEMAFEQDRPHQRFGSAIRGGHFCLAVFGVCRRDALLRTPMIAPFVGSDRSLLAELTLHGKIAIVEQDLFLRRDHPDASMRRFADERDRLAWFDPTRTHARSTPTWHRFVSYARAIERAPLDEHELERCRGVLSKWLKGTDHMGRPVLSQLDQELRDATG